jgi:hypothetical protein
MQNKLMNSILKASNIINEKSMRGSANYIVTSPKTSDYLYNLYIQEQRDIKIDQILKSIENDDIKGGGEKDQI